MKESKTVSYTFDTLPPMTDERRAHLKALGDRPDSEIDFSDSPEWTAANFKRARRGLFAPQEKVSFTADLDANVVEWLRSTGEDYEARMNAILRRAMLAAIRAEMAAEKAADDAAAVDCVGAETIG